MQTPNLEANPLAHIFGRAIGQQKAAVTYAQNNQIRIGRIVEMARIVIEATDASPKDTEGSRILACAEVILEAAETARDQDEEIERSLSRLAAILTEGAGHA